MKAKQQDVVKERERQIAINKGEAARLQVEEGDRRRAQKKQQKQVMTNYTTRGAISLTLLEILT